MDEIADKFAKSACDAKSMGLMGYCFISDTDGFRHNFFLRILIKEKMSMGEL